MVFFEPCLARERGKSQKEVEKMLGDYMTEISCNMKETLLEAAMLGIAEAMRWMPEMIQQARTRIKEQLAAHAKRPNPENN